MQEQMASMQIMGLYDLDDASWRAFERAAEQGQDYPVTLLDEQDRPHTVHLLARTIHVAREMRLRYGSVPLAVGRRPVGHTGRYGPPKVAYVAPVSEHLDVAICCEHEWAYFKEHGTLAGQPPCAHASGPNSPVANRATRRKHRS